MVFTNLRPIWSSYHSWGTIHGNQGVDRSSEGRTGWVTSTGRQSVNFVRRRIWP